MFSKTYCGVADNQLVWLCQVVYPLTLTNIVSGGVGRIVNEITPSHEAPDFYSEGWSSEPFGDWLTIFSIFVVRPLYSFLKYVMADICISIFYSYQNLCVSGFFIDIKSFRSHYGPGVDSTSNRN